jgi:glycerophosphoryl diester phosphodiesterase
VLSPALPALLISSFLASTSGVLPAESFPFFEPVRPARKLQVMAHRGAMMRAPENTAAAIELSIADTVEWVEVDVRLTRDGYHVLFHDEDLDGKTNVAGRVRDLTLAEVRAADVGSKFARRFAGQRVLTLKEGLALARNRVNLYLDCKEIDPPLLAREVLDAEMGRQVVVYDRPEVLQKVRATAGEAIGLMTKWRPQLGFDPWLDQVRPHAVEIDAAEVTAEICREFHGRGVKVQAMALADHDRPAVWDRVAAAGVDWVQTDHAEEIVARRTLQAIKTKRVKVAHHRGASRYAPENTIEALQKAMALGADFVEFDIRTTRDGVAVLLHDGSLNRTTSGGGPLRQATGVEIGSLDAGSWFGRPFAGAKAPTLDGFLDAVAPMNVDLYVDAKDIAPESLAEVLARHKLTERSVVYQSATYLERLRSVAPTLRRMPPLGNPSDVEALAGRVQPYAFDTKWTILSRPLIDRCHALGIKVFSDALGAHESVEQYQQAIRDGIDLIQTDHPLRVVRALELFDDAGGSGKSADEPRGGSPVGVTRDK